MLPYARSMAKGDASAQIMENSSADEEFGWLRQCSRGLGEDGVCPGAVVMEIGGV
jgi:hypothetical protein